jgi:hypothetical protein
MKRVVPYILDFGDGTASPAGGDTHTRKMRPSTTGDVRSPLEMRTPHTHICISRVRYVCISKIQNIYMTLLHETQMMFF